MNHFVILKREKLQITTFSFFSELKSLQWRKQDSCRRDYNKKSIYYNFLLNLLILFYDFLKFSVTIKKTAARPTTTEQQQQQQQTSSACYSMYYFSS